MNSNRVNCVIVEDEVHNTRLLESYISQIDRLHHIGSFTNAIDLMNFQRLEEVQIIYLDIQMPTMTGLEFLRSQTVQSEVIIITAYSEYALEGYDLNITDYLLKPVELSRFVKATQKALENLRLQESNPQPSKDAHLMLKVDKKLVKVIIKDILYVQSDWNYVYVHTLKQRHMVLSTMKGIEQLLSEHKFIRIHKSYLINMDHFEFVEGAMAKVGGSELPVSRKYRNQLMEALK